MAKAVLVLDMPENCEDCQFGEIIEWGMMMCSWEHRSLPMRGGRPDWCPLIPEPEHDENGDIVWYDPTEPITEETVEKIKAIGWNACLDALEGKT